MKRNLLALAAAGAIALGGFVVVQAQAGPGGARHWHGHAFGLKGITEKLDLTADQQTKLDAIEKAHQDMLNAKKQLHDAMED
jgi:Spy/CpxP family protein refolding chaperone